MIVEKINPADFEWQIIINPNALSLQDKQYKEQLENELRRIGFSYKLYVAESGIGTCREQACKLCQVGFRHFLIVGGDGTINEIINGIFQSGIDTNEVYMAILPMGTGNDFCRTHLYPKKLTTTIDILTSPTFIKHDIGIVKTINKGEITAERYFINIAGFGFDAAVIQRTIGNKPKHFSSAIYLLNLLKSLFRHKSQDVNIELDNTIFKERIFTMAIGIGQYNGNGMKQVPMAVQDDGLFDVVIIRNVGPLKVIANVKKLYAGEHISLKEVSTYKTQHLTIKSSDLILGEVEGEMLQQGDYDISILPRCINIMTMQKPTC